MDGTTTCTIGMFCSSKEYHCCQGPTFADDACCLGFNPETCQAPAKRRLLADLSTCCVFTGSYVGTSSPLSRDRFPALLKPSELLRLRELD
jgi:hypothetical protein